MSIKEERAVEAIKGLAATFIGMESNKTSLITVTHVEMRNRGKDAVVYFSVLPENSEHAVSDFLSRKKTEMRNFLKGKIKMRVLPHFSFEIDTGEKNRQKIERIIYEDKNR